MRLPDFVIIGAAKSATTTIYKYLASDPGIFIPVQKELEFFGRDDVYLKGEEWYSRLFAETRKEQLCGDASTIYSLYPFFPDSASRMHSLIPNAKLIYIMRDPVQRAYSHYVQFVKNYQNCFKSTLVPKTFEEFLYDQSDDVGKKSSPYLASFDSHYPYDPQLLIAGGMYMRQINNYLRYYEKSSMHLMLFEEFINAPLHELTNLYSFLGVGIENLSANFREMEDNVADVHFDSLRAEQFVSEIKSTPLINIIGKLSTVRFRNNFKKFIANSSFYRRKYAGSRPQKMLPETRNYLKNIYLKPTEDLSAYLGKDMVSYWSLNR